MRLIAAPAPGLCNPLARDVDVVKHRGMSEHEEFVAWVNTVLRDAEVELHNGDASLRRAIWSRNDPVTVVGAWMNASGQAELDVLFAHLADSFSNCTSYQFELMAAEVLGDVAYTAGFEHRVASVNGVPRSYTVRATQIIGASTASGKWRTDTAAHPLSDQTQRGRQVRPNAA